MALEFLNETPAEAAEMATMRDEAPPAAETPKAAETPAETPAEQPKAAEGEPAKAVEKPADERPKFVPHAALHEERLKRQAAEKELADLRAGKTPEAPKEEIDPDSDPIAALKEIKTWQKKQQDDANMQQELQQFDTRVKTHEADYAAADPEYGDKVAFVQNWRANQIRANAAAMGDQVTDQQIGQMLVQEARKVAWDALNRGKNPGEVFAALAQANGYKAKAAEPATPAEPEIDPEVAKQTKESEAVVDRIARGQRAGRPTAGAGGNAPSGEMTLADLVNLDGAAFDKAFEKFSKSQRSVH